MSTSHRITDLAHFDPTADEAAIRTALACPSCGRAADLVRVEADIAGGFGGRHSVASCGCGRTTRLGLTDHQAFRLWTLPRGRLFVHVSAAAL